MGSNLISLAYLLAAILFILGLKRLSSPRTARQGNLMGSCGMLVAVLATLVDQQIVRFDWIIAGLTIGSLIGVTSALKIPITAMPQLVSLFNGFGGGASALVATTVVVNADMLTDVSPVQIYGSSSVSLLIGMATFTGSVIAWAKLQGVYNGQPRGITVRASNALFLAVSVLLAGYFLSDPTEMWVFWGLAATSSIYGLLLTLPVGGADMPVVIALLNSWSGVAAAASGFALDNNVLIISGSLVGASGLFLTRVMCDAMNRSLANVLTGDFRTTALAPSEEIYQGRVKSTSSEEAALIFEAAQVVAIVPGYGMAVAQAQHAVRDFAGVLQNHGIEVRYGIHAVAGRMPGHMNVLLAEADVAYDELYDMDHINPTFSETDVVLVIGANDVVNPAARDDPSSPIAGMPILDVGKAQTVIVIKRSLAPGFAGIPNELFTSPNTLMLFGDGKETVRNLVAATKELIGDRS